MIKSIKKLFDNPLLFLYVISVFAIIIFSAVYLFFEYLYLYSEYWLPIYDFYESSLETQEKKETPDTFKILELHNFFGQFARNSGWLVWMGISLFALLVTMFLTIWGRYTQDKQSRTQHASHLHDRYEKAANMLGNEVMAVRVAGCRALMSLGMDDKNMKRQCVRLLLIFLRNPYIEEKDKYKRIFKREAEKLGLPPSRRGINKDELLRMAFPDDEPLRDDIQEAVDSFFAIRKYYGDAEIDEETVALPNYYLYNRTKDSISLTNQRLKGI